MSERPRKANQCEGAASTILHMLGVRIKTVDLDDELEGSSMRLLADDGDLRIADMHHARPHRGRMFFQARVVTGKSLSAG